MIRRPVSPFQQGRTLALFPAAFVPRLLWPGKPEITLGQWITDTYGGRCPYHFLYGPDLHRRSLLEFRRRQRRDRYGLRLGRFYGFSQTRFLGPHPTAVGILAAIVVIAQLVIRQIGSAAAVLSTTAFSLATILVVHFVVAYFARGKAPPVVSTWGQDDDAGAGGGARF